MVALVFVSLALTGCRLLAGAKMINLESETPYFYWTFDKLDDLNQNRSQYAFGSSVWRSDAILVYDIGQEELTFESPEEWGDGLPPLNFRRISDGRYQCSSGRVAYDAVRADTKTHVVLTGHWTEPGFGEGAFVAVFPIKQAAEVLLEAGVAMPVEAVQSYA